MVIFSGILVVLLRKLKKYYYFYQGVFSIIVLWGIIVQRVYVWNGQPADVDLMTRLSERNSILINILSLVLFMLFIN